MSICLHKWSNVKRWHDRASGLYFTIQRCRRCNEWVRRTIDLKNEKMEVVTEYYSQRVKERKQQSSMTSQPNVDSENSQAESAEQKKSESE